MRAGQMRTLLQPQAPTRVSDGAGGFLDGWADVGPQLWARVEPVSAREQLRAQIVASEVNTRITMRWSAEAEAIKQTWRLVDVTPGFARNTLYNVSGPGIMKGLRNEEIEFAATSLLNKG